MSNTNLKETPLQPFSVFVRIRPLLEKEEQSIFSFENSSRFIRNFIHIYDDQMVITEPEIRTDIQTKKEKIYNFDRVFQEGTTNKTIFEEVIRQMIDNVLKGYNSTALAYGVTGTGKTHTMFGDLYNENSREKGACSYASEYLFNKINNTYNNSSFRITASYLEIYNEQVIDLTIDNSNNLLIAEDPIRGVVVPELKEYPVKEFKQLVKLILNGNNRRMMAPTGHNQFSSRSHAIVQVNLEQKPIKSNDYKEETIFSKFLFVDLAGSERGGLEKGIRLQEGSNINKSLLALGNCINLLSDQSKKGFFVPYRDSKLTRILKDSLGGNILTSMIACINPSPLSYEDIINTLNYASRAKKIVKKVVKNIKESENPSAQYKEIIESLKLEIFQLKETVKNQNHLLTKNITITNPIMNLNNLNISPIKSRMTADDNKHNIDFQLSENKDNDKDQNSNQNKINVINQIKFNMNNTAYEVNLNFYKKFLEEKTTAEIEDIEDLEKYIESLKFDQNFLEEQFEKGLGNESTNNTYLSLKTYLERFLELINEKLVKNIEEHMILNSNYKEILDLNNSNETEYESLKTQLRNAELSLNNEESDKNEIEKDIQKINEDIKNLEKIMEENNKIRENIVNSLDSNSQNKKKFKKILIKLMSNSNKKEITDWHKAYQIIENEKNELESKTASIQIYLEQVMNEKKEIESQKNNLCLILNDRDKRIQELEKLLKEQKRENQEKVSKDKNERNNPLSTSGQFIFFPNNNKNKITIGKEYLKHNSLMISPTRNIFNSEKDKDKNFLIDIDKITPLNNFKIDFNTCKFTRIDLKTENTNKQPNLHQKNKKSLSQQVRNDTNLNHKRNPDKINIKDNNQRNQIKNVQNNIEEIKKINEDTKGDNKFFNSSINLSKVTLNNELCYNSEYEFLDNFKRENDDKSLLSPFEAVDLEDDELILSQFNEIRKNNKIEKNLENLKKISKNNPKPKDDVKLKTLDRELNKIFDSETVDIYNNIFNREQKISFKNTEPDNKLQIKK